MLANFGFYGLLMFDITFATIIIFQLFARSKKKRQNNEVKKHTGHNSAEEWIAYDKGREDEQKVLMDFIGKWDGQTNSAMGTQLMITFINVYKDVLIKELINHNPPVGSYKETFYIQLLFNAIKSVDKSGVRVGYEREGGFTKKDMREAMIWMGSFLLAGSDKVILNSSKVECSICGAIGKVQVSDVEWDQCRRCDGSGYVSAYRQVNIEKTADEYLLNFKKRNE